MIVARAPTSCNATAVAERCRSQRTDHVQGHRPQGSRTKINGIRFFHHMTRILRTRNKRSCCCATASASFYASCSLTRTHSLGKNRALTLGYSNGSPHEIIVSVDVRVDRAKALRRAWSLVGRSRRSAGGAPQMGGGRGKKSRFTAWCPLQAWPVAASRGSHSRLQGRSRKRALVERGAW